MTKKILIADDEPSIVIALEFLLRRSGYEVQIARDGDEALRLVETMRPDLVLLDIMMPVKSGYEVCKELRERPESRDVKIIMLSAKGRDAEVALRPHGGELRRRNKGESLTWETGDPSPYLTPSSRVLSPLGRGLQSHN